MNYELIESYAKKGESHDVISALTLLTKAYINQCGVSMGSRTVIYCAAEQWLERLAWLDLPLSAMARKEALVTVMPYITSDYDPEKYDDNDHTAWIKQGHIGRCKTYRIPSSVNIEGLPYTITSVELGAFKCQRTLQHLIFPDTIEYIDEDEFSYLPNLRSVYIGKGVQYLNNWHFRCCPKLHTITIDKHNPYIKVQDGLVLTHDGTTLLRSLFRRRELIIPEGVTRVEKVAFWYDDKLESISFPTSICEIGDNSFSNIPNLKKVIIPEGLRKTGILKTIEVKQQ